ncbi:head-tail connector protein [Nonomuraea typhae]|uniref:head-tail connector protein n=1 Tax=Nonomuraea typhae TaxID=2603600 RepID=UPI0012F93C2B|nr:head-tail connector protein [Nonomuraea typhae]
MANEYATLADLKEYLAITDNARDNVLFNAIAAASRAIDKKTGRRFWLDGSVVQRTFNPYGRVVRDERGELLLVDDIGSASGLVIETGSGGSWSAVTGYETTPDNALLDGRPVTGLLLATGTWGTRTSRVRVTARWGWPAVPDEIEQATLLQASRLYKRKDTPEGVAGSADWGLMRVPHLDPDVRALIEPFMLPGFA